MAEEFDIGFDLLPADESELTPEEELEAALGGVPLPEDEEASDGDPDEVPLGRSWAFDFERGQFIRHGVAPARTAGFDTLKTWIEKTIRTARLAHPIYTPQYGMSLPIGLMVGRPFSPDLAGQYADSVREALLVHDRITDVKDFTFDGGPQLHDLNVAFTVVVDDDDEFQIQEVPVAMTTERSTF